WELKFAASICNLCPVGCNLTYNTRREAMSGGEIVIKRTMPRQNEQVNELWICDKGRFVYHFTEDKARLTQPLVRKQGELQPASWEEALSLVAGKFSAAKADLLTVVSGQLANEDLYNLHTLTERLGGKSALYTQMGGGDLTARAGLTPGSNLGDLGQGDAILVVASDLEEEAPLWWLRVKQAAERGATLIVANPRPTKMDRQASFKLRYAYGQESQTIQKLPESEAGKAFASAKNGVIFFGSEGLGLAGSQSLAQACTNLLLQTRHTGRANNGLVGVWRRGNDQGAWDIGFRPLKALNAKVLYIAGADPAGDNPALVEAIQAAEFVVVQELFLTETAQLADVVLPAQAYTEREGTFTSAERRVQRFYPAARPKGQSWPDFEIAAQIGAQAGVSLKGRFPSIVFPQLAREVPGYGELTYQKLAEVHEQWPIVGREDLYYGGTGYANSQGLGVQLPTVGGASFKDPAPPARPSGALVAVPITRLYDHGSMVLPSKVLHPRLVEPYIAINPRDAEVQKAADGMLVSVNLAGVEATVTVRVDEHVPAGIALIPRSVGVPIEAPIAIAIQIAEAFPTGD
ncbi:MAG: molybdopterin-dependent oxidoreductase, partial [Anaerolineales bacterium]|nr:molybdopterin-dependent oxidoreductase [Anaerolineales bacterium]